MECPSCGRKNDEINNFCFYCGFNLKDFDPEEERKLQYEKAVQANSIRMRNSKESYAEPHEPMKVWHWALYFVLLAIPYLWLFWIILTFVWAFSSRGTEERRRMAKGMLIATLALAVILMIGMIYIISHYGMDYFVNYITDGTATNADAFMKRYGVY